MVFLRDLLGKLAVSCLRSAPRGLLVAIKVNYWLLCGELTLRTGRLFCARRRQPA